MGSTLTMLVSTVVSLATRLPTVTCSRLTRPSMGDLICVNSRLSFAASTAACAVATWASPWLRRGGRLVELLLRGNLGCLERLGAGEIAVGEFLLRLRLFELAGGLIQRGLVRTRVDDEKQVVLFDHAPSLKGISSM